MNKTATKKRKYYPGGIPVISEASGEHYMLMMGIAFIPAALREIFWQTLTGGKCNYDLETICRHLLGDDTEMHGGFCKVLEMPKGTTFSEAATALIDANEWEALTEPLEESYAAHGITELTQ